MQRFKEYKPQTGAYAVKVKNGAGWKNYSAARLQISVGQEYHEGDKFSATIDWANERFDTITICVNDTLQRYNYMFSGMSEKEAAYLAEIDGHQWTKRNAKAIAQLNNASVVRWDTWKQFPSYARVMKNIAELYDSNALFQKEVDEEIFSFWERRNKTGDLSLSNFDKFHNFSKQYLLEEVAVFSIMFKGSNAVDIYPGSSLLPCKLNQETDLGQRGYTRIDFSRTDSFYNDTKKAA